MQHLRLDDSDFDLRGCWRVLPTIYEIPHRDPF